MLSQIEQKRLAEIRMNVEKFRAMGWNVQDWESAFLLDILDKLLKKDQKIPLIHE